MTSLLVVRRVVESVDAVLIQGAVVPTVLNVVGSFSSLNDHATLVTYPAITQVRVVVPPTAALIEIGLLMIPEIINLKFRLVCTVIDRCMCCVDRCVIPLTIHYSIQYDDNTVLKTYH